MSTQALAEKRSARALKRRRTIEGRLRAFGAPYIPWIKTNWAAAVINFRGYKEPGRYEEPVAVVKSTEAKVGLWQRFVAWFKRWADR